LIRDGEFLTFSLGEEVYGIPIKTAREIIGMMKISRIPKMQDYMADHFLRVLEKPKKE
jgi:Chemotaxis signal transduction protein